MEQWVVEMKASPDYQAMTDYASSAYTGSASFYTNPLSVFINLLKRLVQLLLSGVETLVRSALELLGKVVVGFEKMALRPLSFHLSVPCTGQSAEDII